MKFGLTELFGNLRIFKGSTYVGFQPPSSIPSNFTYTLPDALPSGSTKALTITTSGVWQYADPSGGGSVTSVDFSAPNIFSVSGNPVTTSGTISLTLASQSGNVFFASPSNGSSGTPLFRSLVAADIPSLTSAKISDFDTQVRTSRLDQMASPTSAVSFNSQRITNLTDPTSAQDAATKAYVDATAQGLDVKASCRVATTANITLSGTQTIDGVSVIAGDRVLVKNQSTATQNGIYVCAAGSWSRSTDADSNTEVTPGMFTFVEEGTANADSGWILTVDGAVTLGTTNLTFVQFSGAGQITAGNGLTKTGNTIDVVGTSNRISVASDSIDIDSNYVGQTSITTLGTIATGTWNATAIAVTKGGTGATDAATARGNLVAAGIYKTSFTNASLTAGVLTVNPVLGQQYGQVTVIDNSNQMVIPDNVTFTSSTSWSVDLTSYGSLTGTWNIVCVA